MSSIAALPPPSSSSGPSGLSALRKMLASDVAAVQPVRPIPNDRPRTPQDDIEGVGGADDRRRFPVEETRSRAKGAGTSERALPAGVSEDGPVTATGGEPTSGPTAGFVAQSISQEAMGDGLHIEPWAAAISAYRRADAGPDPGALVRRITV